MFLAEGLRLREQNGADLRPGRRRPPGHVHDPRRAGRGHRPSRPDRHHQLDLQRALRGGPAVRHPRPPLRRPGRLERRHLAGTPSPARTSGAAASCRRRSATSGRRTFLRTAAELFDSWQGDEIIADKRDRRVPGDADARRVRAPRRVLRHRGAVQRSPQPAGAAGDLPGRRLRRGPRLRRVVGRRDLQPARHPGGRAGVLRRREGPAAEVRPRPGPAADTARRDVRARRHRRRGAPSWPTRCGGAGLAGRPRSRFLEQLWNRDLSGYDPDGPLPDYRPGARRHAIASGRASVRHAPRPGCDGQRVARQGRGGQPLGPRADHRGHRPPVVHRLAATSPTRSTSSCRPTPATASSWSRTSRRAA